ncbi:RNA polymerase sigma factor [Nocardioides lacusdianchii]|uniref:RNA polymerase sigma factor n=1 Tax=Nocardioides lacusdianchii TaxID=2783664 RepID=UPI001CD03728|nr:sigma-70 family RNA polymerase sigma factor [Nocardioides lacusdianchii]
MFTRDTQPPLDLESFCHAEHPRLVRLLSLHTGDVETARDLSQETLVKVCVHWRKVRSLEVPQAWVTRVALNLATSHHRRSAVRRRHTADTGGDTSPTSVRDDEGWMVRAAVASLPERQRTAVILRYFEDLPVDEVADLMGVSPSAVKKLTARGVDRLRVLLAIEDLEVPHA